MIVIISNEAEADLERIVDYIAENNPVRAVTFVKELRERCENLAELPKRFPLVPRYEYLGIRRRVFGAYLIFYRIESSTIEVIHIFHGAADYTHILFPEE